MNLIDHIENEDQLKNVRHKVERMFRDQFSMDLKQRKLDEATAWLVGASDFNTALGIARQREQKSSETNSIDLIRDKLSVDRERRVVGWFRTILGIIHQDHLGEGGDENQRYQSMKDLLADPVYCACGTSKDVDEQILDNGIHAMLMALDNEGTLELIYDDITQVSSIREKDLLSCVEKAGDEYLENVREQGRVAAEPLVHTPFDITEYIGY